MENLCTANVEKGDDCAKCWKVIHQNCGKPGGLMVDVEYVENFCTSFVENWGVSAYFVEEMENLSTLNVDISSRHVVHMKFHVHQVIHIRCG